MAWNASGVFLDSLERSCRTSESNCIKLSASSGLAPSPVLDLDQFCQVGEQARLNSNSIVMMLVFLLTVLRVEEAGQCITEFSGTGHRIECITELIWNSKCLFFNSSFPLTGHKTMCITELLRTGHCTEHF